MPAGTGECSIFKVESEDQVVFDVPKLLGSIQHLDNTLDATVDSIYFKASFYWS